MNKTKEVIFDSAIKIFSINGYNGATMDEISQTAGVAKGTLYYHFKSKEEIFIFIINEGMKLIKEKTLTEVNKEKDGIGKLKAFCKLQLNIVIEYRDFFKVLMSQLWGENSINIELRNALSIYLADIELYLKRAEEDGLIKTGDLFLMSCNIFGAVCSLAVNNLIKNDNISNSKDLDIMLDYILFGIKNT